MRLPTDLEKLKLLSREYIIKHCIALEKEADATKSRLVEWRDVIKGQAELCASIVNKYAEEFYKTPLEEVSIAKLIEQLMGYDVWESLYHQNNDMLSAIRRILEGITQ